MTQPAPTDPARFEEMYRDERTSHGLPAATPWDIGGPQPVVQQLVALGAIKGEVLDPGTGPATTRSTTRQRATRPPASTPRRPGWSGPARTRQKRGCR